MRIYSFCAQCGINVMVDGDGCCASCGATATGDALKTVVPALGVRDAIKALRLANRNLGRDWPTVSLAVAVALESLGVKVRKPLPKSRKR